LFAVCNPLFAKKQFILGMNYQNLGSMYMTGGGHTKGYPENEPRINRI